MRDDIGLAKITTKYRFTNAKLKFHLERIPKQQRWKEYPGENNTKATKFEENVAQTRLAGGFWAC